MKMQRDSYYFLYAPKLLHSYQYLFPHLLLLRNRIKTHHRVLSEGAVQRGIRSGDVAGGGGVEVESHQVDEVNVSTHRHKHIY